jgi:hypothetical protein
LLSPQHGRVRGHGSGVVSARGHLGWGGPLLSPRHGRSRGRRGVGKGREDIHPEGRARPQQGQQGPFRRKDERTYKLRAERGCNRVSRVHFGEGCCVRGVGVWGVVVGWGRRRVWGCVRAWGFWVRGGGGLLGLRRVWGVVVGWGNGWGSSQNKRRPGLLPGWRSFSSTCQRVRGVVSRG